MLQVTIETLGFGIYEGGDGHLIYTSKQSSKSLRS
jgi:hypothetical protein